MTRPDRSFLVEEADRRLGGILLHCGDAGRRAREQADGGKESRVIRGEGHDGAVELPDITVMGSRGEGRGVDEQLIQVGVVRVCIGRAGEDRGVAEAVRGVIGEGGNPALIRACPDIVLNVCDRCRA